MQKNRLTKVVLILFVATLLVIACITIYGKFNGSVPRAHYEALKKAYEMQAERLSALNRELNSQLSGIKETVREITEERNALEHDKSQLLLMLEKLEQRVNKSYLANDGEKMVRKFALSWLMRISELKTQYVAEGARARDLFVDEVNQIVEGLKEDFSEDSFFSQVRDCTISSDISKDIKNAQKKLDTISKHLRESYLPNDD